MPTSVNFSIKGHDRSSLFSQRVKKALIVQGGFAGHHPKEIAALLAGLLVQAQFEVEISDTLDVFLDKDTLAAADLIVPVWTGGTLTPPQLDNLLEAVSIGGSGLAGVHGGIADAFRCEVRYQQMVGAQYVVHPGDLKAHYRVNFTKVPSPITAGLSDFAVTTEQYYMLVDPANIVLADTLFPVAIPPEVWRPVTMPVAWVKMYGKGRVFAHTLGHYPETLLIPPVLAMTRRGMMWAARQAAI